MSDTYKDTNSAQAEEVTQTEEASTKSDKAALSRRSLLMGAGGLLGMMALGSLGLTGAKPGVRPPGGQDETHLFATCVRCQKCYEACPRKVITPAHIEDGFVGMRTPVLNFDSNYCDFCAEDNNGVPLCVQSCPTNALALPAQATAKNTILGIAVIDSYQCLAYRDTGCRYCFDACPHEAIEFKDTGDAGSFRPVVVADRCNGCGACESVCVSLTTGSIVSGSTERAIVIKPVSAM